ncbi:Dabb family protein [Desulfatirhabdium butyrativorans]|uniref:Dabb family protein n=1 Tax=Desulfatirhabdium butyrativorans TaxID=340467 RepID=UPI0003FBC65F|nr:Dabb family protein [Desulfatirhabdium butyrativorans]
MLSHIVLFWLKPELSSTEVQAFREGLEVLKTIPTTRGVYIGTPAPTAPRPIIDTSYSIGVTVLFDSIADQEAYQVHPAHQGFLKQFSQYWSKILIYDFM